jgi:hypothetical protein
VDEWARNAPQGVAVLKAFQDGIKNYRSAAPK